MPALADTTVRLLGQEPLAGRLPTAEQLRIAEILDGAGFAYLEVSGGGCFDSAVRRGIESPWERIRALKGRVKTPLGLALRGRLLVGSRPVDSSFPSGHSAASFAAASALTAYYPTAGPLLFAGACCVGLSRVYLGHHFPSDVAVGGALGSAIGLLSARLWRRWLG